VIVYNYAYLLDPKIANGPGPAETGWGGGAVEDNERIPEPSYIPEKIKNPHFSSYTESRMPLLFTNRNQNIYTFSKYPSDVFFRAPTRVELSPPKHSFPGGPGDRCLRETPPQLRRRFR